MDPEALYDYPIYQSDSEPGNIESQKIVMRAKGNSRKSQQPK